MPLAPGVADCILRLHPHEEVLMGKLDGKVALATGSQEPPR